MDVRDFAVWAREAMTRALVRRSERYAASLLPHRDVEDVNRELKRLEAKVYEAGHEEEIEEAEREMREYLEGKRKKRRK